MRKDGRYRIVSVQGNPTSAGMQSTIITLEDKEAVKKVQKLKAERKCINGILLSSILLLILGVFCFGVVVYRINTEISEITPKETATEQIESEAIPETETVIIPYTDFYHEEIPLRYAEQKDLYKASEEFGVDYHTMLGLIERETNFRNIYGDGGKAYGYCQVWPYWWSEKMQDIGASDLNNPEDNFRTACAIVAELTDRYGSIEGALTAYNMGSYDGTATEYARVVMENAEKWRAKLI